MSRMALIAPHNDDETLFAAYTLQRLHPHVIVALRDRANPRRERETRRAVAILTGREAYEQWDYDAAQPDWKALTVSLAALATEYDVIYAPAWRGKPNGYHPGRAPQPGWGVLQHEHIGWLAQDQLGERVRSYYLYTRWEGRHNGEVPVVPEAAEIARKLQALACYESAIEEPTTRDWFYERLDMREWVA